MTLKQCANCGELNPSESNFCFSCGSKDFKDIPPRLASRLGDAKKPVGFSSAVGISVRRVILVSVLSFGLYLIYWFYLTWKQLASETNEEHHPVWHALTLLVPVYGLYRMHAHVRVIKELATRQGIAFAMAPGLAVVLLLVSNVLDWRSLRITDYVVLIALSLISVMLTTTVVVMAQTGLNAYWEKVRRPDSLTDARVGVGEVVFVVIGILLWIVIFIPPSLLE